MRTTHRRGLMMVVIGLLLGATSCKPPPDYLDAQITFRRMGAVGIGCSAPNGQTVCTGTVRGARHTWVGDTSGPKDGYVRMRSYTGPDAEMWRAAGGPNRWKICGSWIDRSHRSCAWVE